MHCLPVYILFNRISKINNNHCRIQTKITITVRAIAQTFCGCRRDLSNCLQKRAGLGRIVCSTGQLWVWKKVLSTPLRHTHEYLNSKWHSQNGTMAQQKSMYPLVAISQVQILMIWWSVSLLSQRYSQSWECVSSFMWKRSVVLFSYKRSSGIRCLRKKKHPWWVANVW